MYRAQILAAVITWLLTTVILGVPTGLENSVTLPILWNPEFGSMQPPPLALRSAKSDQSLRKSAKSNQPPTKSSGNPISPNIKPTSPKPAGKSQIPIGPNPPDDKDPFDLSGLKSLAAIGDSYIAGIGAGTLVSAADAKDCSRYNGSYANVLNNWIGGGPGRRFSYLACSGATSPEILENQVPNVPDNTQAMLVSAGGNDVGLSDILEACVFAYHPFQDCAGAIKESHNSIQNDLAGNIKNLISESKKKLAKDGILYYVTYAKFFDASTTQCDKVTWAFPTATGNRPFLTQDLREQLNDLVDATNRVLNDVISKAGDQVIAVNYDDYFGQFTGRYCEPGVTEPDPNRPLTLFYEWYTGTSSPGGELTVELKQKPKGGKPQSSGRIPQKVKPSSLQSPGRTRGSAKPAKPPTPSGKTGSPKPEKTHKRGIEHRHKASREVDLSDSPPAIRRSAQGTAIIPRAKAPGAQKLPGLGSEKSSSGPRPARPGKKQTAKSDPRVPNSSKDTKNPKDDKLPKHKKPKAKQDPKDKSNSKDKTNTKRLKGSKPAKSSFKAKGKSKGKGNLFANPPRSRHGNKDVEKAFLDDSVKRVFHPQELGHMVIARLIIYKMAAQRAKRIDVEIAPETPDPHPSCKVTPPTSSSSTSSSSSSSPPSSTPTTSACDRFSNGACSLQGCEGSATGKCTAGEFKGLFFSLPE